MKKHIHLIAAARPNFMKIAPLYHALKKVAWANPVIVHTGQHYDVNMSDAFFADLRLPEPDIHLGIGSGTHAEQTGQVMIAYEEMLNDQKPDMVIVVGDVNSTIACTLAAAKISYGRMGEGQAGQSRTASSVNEEDRPMIAHLEAGLRSFDRSMPEEINRLATDVLADILWTPSPDADQNLLKEGVAPHKIVRVGNIMIDSLEMLRHKIEELSIHMDLGLTKKEYGVVTLHRPSNVDNPAVLQGLCESLNRISQMLPLVFPVHPRTRKNLEKTGLMDSLAGNKRLFLLEPQSYIKFMNLVFNCRMVITDSGGIQEETTYLGIPCLTMRPNTERPATIHEGTNKLCRTDQVVEQAETILSGGTRHRTVPEFWDGKTSGRIIESIKSFMQIP
ncbi:MAG: UDP-N-acetylglucosamine 2-epimerase (non-hydrolyzing) [Gammaproteobacteria bacterium]|nr:UDP-N-acetylglucosamine 2-epimerase (non-hydrolyzing) [Gammaproteobacteria bacterium]